jgi:hypothetical protein
MVEGSVHGRIMSVQWKTTMNDKRRLFWKRSMLTASAVLVLGSVMEGEEHKDNCNLDTLSVSQGA